MSSIGNVLLSTMMPKHACLRLSGVVFAVSFAAEGSLSLAMSWASLGVVKRSPHDKQLPPIETTTSFGRKTRTTTNSYKGTYKPIFPAIRNKQVHAYESNSPQEPCCCLLCSPGAFFSGRSCKSQEGLVVLRFYVCITTEEHMS